ncbi:MAG: hypothetical protein WC471_00390 [Candidatus Woesearchaeota archaeon]
MENLIQYVILGILIAIAYSLKKLFSMERQMIRIEQSLLKKKRR